MTDKCTTLIYFNIYVFVSTLLITHLSYFFYIYDRIPLPSLIHPIGSAHTRPLKKVLLYVTLFHCWFILPWIRLFQSDALTSNITPSYVNTDRRHGSYVYRVQTTRGIYRSALLMSVCSVVPVQSGMFVNSILVSEVNEHKDQWL
jgi:hypothetical protein